MTTTFNRLNAAAFALMLGMAGCETTTAPAPSNLAAATVVYFQRLPIHGWQAVDWKGILHGSIGSDHVGIPYQSPDGSRLAWSSEGVWQVVDSNGKLLSQLDLSKSRSFTWADDSSGLCVLNAITDNPPNGGSYQLDFDPVTAGSRTIASVATSKGPNVAVWSPSPGRVGITTASGSTDALSMMRITFCMLSVMDFSTGTVRFDRRFPIQDPSNQVSAVIVSHDGALAAIATPMQTTVLSLTDGALVYHTTGLTPTAFSWDSKQLAAETLGNRGEVLSLTTGEAVWRDAVTNRVAQGAVPDPAGSDLMLFETTGGLNDLLVVSPAGVERTIAKGVFPSQVAPCSNCSAF